MVLLGLQQKYGSRDMVGFIKKYQQIGKPLMYLGVLIFLLSLINAKYPSSHSILYNFQNAKIVYGYKEGFGSEKKDEYIPSWLTKNEKQEKSLPLSTALSVGIIFFISGMYITQVKIK